MTIINEERNYRELKESIRMIKGQEGKKIDIDQPIKYKTMLSYCLKCKKNTQSNDPVILKTINGETIILSQCPICGAKNQNLLKNKKQRDY